MVALPGMAALYQRARPVTFAELVGQEHVKDVLEAAVKDDRTSHAYLFSGPRGVGKTTTARLLAMAVNCEPAVKGAARPCGECESCRMVRSVTHPDVIELDAASNNSVDDVRDLQAHIGLSSMRGGKRVWILDEAHMLSKAAANALLKTLEEPPPGLIFVLATTEPEKLPPTILSRCQHFRFRRLADAEIRSKLERLCADAGVSAESEALALIARSADGGMRDAESLLERLLVKGEPLTRAAAEQALGLPAQERLGQMGAALLAGDLGALLDEAGGLYRDGYAPRTIAEQLARALRDELHLVLGRKASWGGSERDPLLALLHALDDESERFVRQNDLYALEVALIKSLNAVAPPSIQSRPAASSGERRAATAVPPAEAPAQAAREVSAPTPEAPADAPPTVATAPKRPEGRGQPARAEARQATAETPAEPERREQTPQREAAPFSWHAVRTAANPQLKAFLHPARVEVDGLDVTVHYDDKHAFHRTQLISKLDELRSHVAAVAGPDYRVSIAGAGSTKDRGRGTGPAKGRPASAVTSEPPARSVAPTKGAAGEAGPAPEAPQSPAPAASERTAEPTEEPVAARPEAVDPSDYAPTELELAGFDEDHGAWPDDQHPSAGEGYDDPARPQASGATARQGTLEQQAASLLAHAGSALAEVQQLFPGRVTQVVTAAAAAPRAGAAALDDLDAVDAAGMDTGDDAADEPPDSGFDGSGIAPDDGSEDGSEDDDSYDDDSQDRLSFGP